MVDIKDFVETTNKYGDMGYCFECGNRHIIKADSVVVEEGYIFFSVTCPVCKDGSGTLITTIKDFEEFKASL